MDSNLKVIKLIKTKPELYDTAHPDYSNKRHHTHVWKQLGAKLGVKVQNLKGKWNSLRNSYARTIRPEILTPGAAPRSWYLKSYMDFLRPHVIHKIKRSQYLEKIRNGDIVDDDSQMVDFNDLDETQDVDVTNSMNGDEAFSSGMNSDDDNNILIENQPIDCSESSSQVMTTVHDFTLSEDKIQQSQTKKDDSKDTRTFFKATSTSNERIPSSGENLDLCTLPASSSNNCVKSNNSDKIKKLSEKYSLRHSEDDHKYYQISKKKLKKKKSKKFDKVLEVLSSYCAEQMSFANETKSDNLFFQSIMSDYEKLSEKKKRKFKSRILSELNDLLDETEMENNNNSSNGKDKSN